MKSDEKIMGGRCKRKEKNRKQNEEKMWKESKKMKREWREDIKGLEEGDREKKRKAGKRKV